MNKQPLLVCTISFALGIFIQDLFNLPNSSVIGVLLIGFLGLGLGFIKNFFFDRLKSLFLIFLFISAGCFSHFLNTPIIPSFDFPKNKTQNIVFQLNKKLNSNDKNKRYEVEVLNFEKPFLVVISIPKEEKELDFKSFYSTKAYINATQASQYDFQFDYKKYLSRKNINYQAFTPNKILSKSKEKISFSDRIKQKRLDLLTQIDLSSLENKNKSILKGIILADRTEIDHDIISHFSQTGLIHILAISGSHMAIIFLMILFFLKPIFSVQYRNYPIYISLISMWLFAIFIDYGNSVVRSCIMITVYYIMIFLQRRPNLLHSMALSALIILVIDTQQIFDVGFQLSFSAVFGIYWLYQPIRLIYKDIKQPTIRFILNTFTLSLAAQLATLPLILYYFHQMSIMSVFINVVSIMVSQVFIIFSFGICILFSLNLTPNWLLNIYNWCASFFLDMVKFFANTDFSFIENISLNILELIILLILVYFLREIFKKPSVKIFSRFSFITLLFILIRFSSNFYFWKQEEILEHSFFKQNIVSIKQGNQALFIISNDSDLSKLQSFVIKPYITSRRVKHWEINKIEPNSKIRIRNKLYEIK